MITHKPFVVALVAVWLGSLAQTAAAQQAGPSVTLDEAVLHVQQETGGKILSAESRGIGRWQEYRIKVLTPDGHVKVMAISSEASKNPSLNQSTKNPPGKTAGSKERH
ncbi:MAG: hypothetical protein KGM46_02740 [Pseudomonadota bacterium]|jgi:hypothetical protein|nr:hypothetical protein [Xanthomonadaceae bacterium]MDE2248309.1 hypothetical protein [Xanthomonadaceae bacterium]MDE3209639.1 hypothetical protein [Pseudomonadota bacterium]